MPQEDERSARPQNRVDSSERLIAQAEAKLISAKHGAIEASLLSHGQRRVNLIWEYTQAIIAGGIVLTTCGFMVAVGNAISRGHQLEMKMPSEWWTIVGLVIGFYFGRTNHARTGGVGGDRIQEER